MGRMGGAASAARARSASRRALSACSSRTSRRSERIHSRSRLADATRSRVEGVGCRSGDGVARFDAAFATASSVADAFVVASSRDSSDESRFEDVEVARFVGDVDGAAPEFSAVANTVIFPRAGCSTAVAPRRSPL